MTNCTQTFLKPKSGCVMFYGQLLMSNHFIEILNEDTEVLPTEGAKSQPSSGVNATDSNTNNFK